MPPPPEGAAEANESTGDRATAAACSGCHNVVDPIGRIFDLYDDTGKRFATQTMFGALKLNTDVDDSFEDAVELAGAVGDSKALNHCVTKQLYRFALGRDPVAGEQASFESVRDVLDASGSLNDMIRAFVASDSFRKVFLKSDLPACPMPAGN